MKKFILKISIFIFLSLPILNLKAQTLTVIVGTVCADSVVTVPIIVQNMDSVYAFHISMHYNSSLMNYQGYNIVNPMVSNVSLISYDSSGVVNMVINQNTTPISIQNDTLYTLKFHVNSLSNISLQVDSALFWGQNSTLIQSLQTNGAIVMPPVISQQPTDTTVCEGTNITASFSIQAIDTLQSYQWQVHQNNGTNWINLVNDNHYQGVTTEILTIVSPNVQMNNYRYRCFLNEPCSLISDEAILTVTANILNHPHDTLINLGGTAVFSAQASGAMPTYLWEVSTDGGSTWNSSTLFPPITTPNITITAPPVGWSGYKFRCIVSGLCSPPADTTDVATLWVGTAGIEEFYNIVHSVYPNPATDFFTITFKNTGTYTFMLYDATGRNILQIKDIKTDSFTINRENLKAGIYFYRLINSSNGIAETGKIVFY